jgi:hypothetical protein
VIAGLAGLPLAVEVCEYERLHSVLAYEFERVTTRVRLVGAGADGLGEDVSVFREDGTALHETWPSLPLEGGWTLAGFCDHLAALSCGRSLRWDVALRFRNWAFESAAPDLALRQAGRSLHDVLGLEPRPVRFVNSLGLGKVPSMEPVRRRRPRLGAVGHTSPRPSRAPASSEQRGSQDARADPNAGLGGPANQSRASRQEHNASRQGSPQVPSEAPAPCSPRFSRLEPERSRCSSRQ